MRIVYNVKHLFVGCFKIGGKFLTFLTKSVLKGKASICSTIKPRNLGIKGTPSAIFIIKTPRYD